MTQSKKSNVGSGPWRSVFVSSTLIFAVCTAIVTTSLALMGVRSASHHADEAVRKNALMVTELVAKQSGGAIKFSKAEALEKLFADAIDQSGSAAVAGSAFDGNGSPITSGAGTAATDEAARDLVGRALQTAETVRSDDGFAIAAPVRFGKNDEVVGAVLMHWSSAAAKRHQFNDQLRSLFISSLVFLAGLAAAAYFLRRHISQPLVRFRDAMTSVARSDYSTQIPDTGRADEVGAIARTLETFRDALEQARYATEESIFKGAAFEGSTAALMVIDQQFHVQYLNAACRALLGGFTSRFHLTDPGFDADTLVGRSIWTFLGTDDLSQDAVSDPERLPFHCDICVGESRLHLTVSAVRDSDSRQAGFVLEWKDVTEERLNKAALESIDANQIRIEFLVDGSLSSANPKFAAAMQISADDLKGRGLEALFRLARPGGGGDAVSADALADGSEMNGRFAATTANGDRLLLEGSFRQVRDSLGMPLRIVFIGSDITTSQLAIEASEARREELESARAEVVDAISVALDHLANGDLTGRIEHEFSEEYEALRRNFNAAMIRLSEAMGGVVESAEMIGNEAREISSAADDLSRRTEKQAATLEETAAALDALTLSVKSAAEGATSASEMASTAKTSAEKSEGVVRDTVSAMGEIEQSSKEISKIINVIEDIAFQTNLLALNAGVEAARAGESGRGFAVVASEVRALAQRSSEAAQEINALISKSGAQVTRGVGLVDQMGTTLSDIVTSVSEISTHVVAIATSVREQSGNLEEINSAMAQLDSVTQQNAAMFQETTAASHALTNEAKSLAETTLRFNVERTAGPSEDRNEALRIA